jgi:hypothetical protein
MLKDHNEHTKFDYNVLLLYDKFINLERLKHESTSFINYKSKFENLNLNNLNSVINN